MKIGALLLLALVGGCFGSDPRLRIAAAQASGCDEMVVYDWKWGTGSNTWRARGCGREMRCVRKFGGGAGQYTDTCYEDAPHDEEAVRAAAQRLSLETGCPVANITPEAAPVTGGATTAVRLVACGGSFVCDVAAGVATCKHALAQ